MRGIIVGRRKNGETKPDRDDLLDPPGHSGTSFDDPVRAVILMPL